LSYANFCSAQLRDMVAHHPFEGITVRNEEKSRLLSSMGKKRLLILRNHGLLSHTHSMPGNTLPISDEIVKGTTRDSLQFSPAHCTGENVLAALIRRVHRIDASYRG